MSFTSWQYHIGSLEDIVEEMGEVLSVVEEEKKGAIGVGLCQLGRVPVSIKGDNPHTSLVYNTVQ